MPEILVDRKIKRGGSEYLYFNEQLDWHSVAMLFSNIEEVARTSKKYQRQKSKYLAQTLPECTTKWVVLTYLMRELQFIIWIENQLIDFICPYFLT